jgi:hypothetical protein
VTGTAFLASHLTRLSIAVGSIQVYEIQIAFEDGSPSKRAYKRFREFETLYKKTSRLVPGTFSMPGTSGSSITGDDGIKKRTSMERIIGKNQNKWNLEYHLQRCVSACGSVLPTDEKKLTCCFAVVIISAKYLQPLLDALCALPNPWDVTKFVEFLGLGS